MERRRADDMSSVVRKVITAIFGVLLVSAATIGLAETSTTPPAKEALRDPGAIDFSGDPSKPRHHFRVRDPAKLTPDQSRLLYSQLRDKMEAAYRLSGHPIAQAFYRWRQYNAAPFLSATHGQRYVNNYANGLAHDYGSLKNGDRMPVGAVIAKDSFTVTEGGSIHPGPLFLMEKMAEGFNYVSGDWRYTMILPDGSVFGTTGGENSEKVEYCISCHLSREPQDHLFYIPEAYRVKPPNSTR